MNDACQHDEHVNAHGSFHTRELAEGLIGTAGMQSAETIADDEGFRLDVDLLDSIVFICAVCEWWCSQDECNESKNGEWICDECKLDEED